MPKSRSSNSQNPPLSMAAIQALMEQTLGGFGKFNQRQPSKKEQAQDLVYQAMEAKSAGEYCRLIEQALELDPDNVDALLMVTQAARLKGPELIEALQGIVDVGAKSLGKKAFREFSPHFWGVIETRPYMRARMQLADALRESDGLEAAIQEYSEMLILNEHDNQGVRYHLLPCLLALGRLEEARKLMKQFKDDCEWNVVFAWGKVLEQKLSNRTAGAIKALAIARKQNSHMEDLLIGKRKASKTLPDSYSPGTKEEALCYAQPLLMAWGRHPDAVVWLIQQAIASKAKPGNSSDPS